VRHVIKRKEETHSRHSLVCIFWLESRKPQGKREAHGGEDLGALARSEVVAKSLEREHQMFRRQSHHHLLREEDEPINSCLNRKTEGKKKDLPTVLSFFD